MKNSLTNLTASSRSIGAGLVMLLLLAVLVPSACLLWFMSQAMKSEREAARQKLLEAYRGQVNVAQQTLENALRRVADDVERSLETRGAPATFVLAVSSNFADAVICLDQNGKPLYPRTTTPPDVRPLPLAWSGPQKLEQGDPGAAAAAYSTLAQQETNVDLAGQALQAEIRCLVSAGQRPTALEAIQRAVREMRWNKARDAQGRFIIADLEYMALEQATAMEPTARAALIQDLRQQLGDYGANSMPSSQRRFLMHELENLFPGELKFATLHAEDLAAAFVEKFPRLRLGDLGAIRPSSLTNVWQVGSLHGRVLMLHEAGHIESRLVLLASPQALNSDANLMVLPPGKTNRALVVSVPVGDPLPGWRLGLFVNDKHLFDSVADHRIASYLWIGILVLSAIVVIAALVLGLVRKQVALTQLRNDLVANVTHELKTPLSSMRLLVDTLLDSGKLNEQTTREYLQLIAAENLRLSRLIDNFLTFSRIERNKYPFKFNELPVSRIVEQAVASVRDRFNVPGCELKIETAPHLPSIVADGDALVTAVINLLDNAFKYTGDEKHISLSAAPENGSVRFTIRDNGIGLSARDTKRIFRRFYQVNHRLSRPGGGCGLGLSIVKFIVSAHHGNIDVNSQLGKGSVFTLTIPLSPDGHDRPHNGDET